MHDHNRHARAAGLIVLSIVSACAGARTVTVHHGDGSSSTGEHVGGLRDGPWTEYYADGRQRSEGNYENDVQTGLWIYWYENGNEEMEGHFADERRDGEWTSWYEDGALNAQGRFERGFEEGLWRFHSSSGALDREGNFELGKPVLRWTYFNPDGTVRATGNYLAGVKIGEWTTKDADGKKTIDVYPLPAGYECFEESFADSTLKRSGFLFDGAPTGRWITHHPGGKQRFECGFSSGEPNGRACAWREDGTVLASGSLKAGCILGEWIFTRGGAQEKIDFKEERPRQTFAGDWSPASSAAQPGSTVVETWVAELCSPRQPAPLRSVSITTPTPATPLSSSTTASSSGPTPSLSTASSSATATASSSIGPTGDTAGIPARAQPWTEYENGALPALVTLYTGGKANAARDDEDWKTPVLRNRPSKPDGQLVTPPNLLGLLGRPLPVKRFKTADGGEISLDQYVGKKNVVVTILRGFGGQVCVYCTAQTKALADFADKFAALDTEIVVVFPGPASGLEAFRDAYRRTFGADEKLPYTLLYDTDLALTRALHIEDNIAMPTSILLDRKGLVRWCHVAKNNADRPSAQQVIDEIEALPKDKR